MIYYNIKGCSYSEITYGSHSAHIFKEGTNSYVMFASRSDLQFEILSIRPLHNPSVPSIPPSMPFFSSIDIDKVSCTEKS